MYKRFAYVILQWFQAHCYIFINNKIQSNFANSLQSSCIFTIHLRNEGILSGFMA